MTNLASFLKETAERFRIAGITSYQADAEVLIAHFLDVSRGELLAKAFVGHHFIPNELLLDAIERRSGREPLQHLTGIAAFRNLTLLVGPGVFIPRPETESLVSIAVSFLVSRENPRVLDIGTGSGAIAISLASETGSTVDAIEKSDTAATYARRNIEASGTSVNLLIGDFRELNLDFGGYDLVISNPPYIPQNAVPIDPEVRDYDPELALYGGADGLDLIRELADLSHLLLAPSGMLVLEHADGQSDMVCELLLANWQSVRAHPDPTGRLRSVSAIR
jgi:release factor glutamine methyltransferase